MTNWEAFKRQVGSVMDQGQIFWSDLGRDLMRGEFMAGAKRAQTNLVGLFVGVLVATIMGVAVVIPVVNDILADSNVSGTTATILGLIPLFIGLLILIALASPLMRQL